MTAYRVTSSTASWSVQRNGRAPETLMLLGTWARLFVPVGIVDMPLASMSSEPKACNSSGDRKRAIRVSIFTYATSLAGTYLAKARIRWL